MDPKTKLLSETYRLFNPYHDKIGRFASKAGGAVSGAVKRGVEKRKKFVKTAAKTTGAYHAITSAKRLYKTPAGKAVRAKAKKVGKWMKAHPQETAAIVMAGVGIAGIVASQKWMGSVREQAQRAKLGDGAYEALKKQGMNLTR